MSQNYGVLRVVRVRPLARASNKATTNLQRYPGGWLPEERLVHLLTRQETTIGRALDNDIVLVDTTVSRTHARLVFDEYGWRIVNLTVHNVVRVNGHSVPGGGSLPMQPQDVVVLGSTMLQLIAPQQVARLANGKYPTLQQNGASTTLDSAEQQQPTSFDEAAVSPRLDSGDQHDAASCRQTISSISAEQGERSLTAFPRPADSLLVQPEPELEAQDWHDEEEEYGIGVGVTMQFALPQHIGPHTRWLIAGIGITIMVISTIITLTLNSLVGISAFIRNGPSSVVIALAIPLLPAFGIGLLVNFIDRFEREPWFLRLASFFWGAIIAIPPASFIETNIDTFLQSVLGSDNLLHALLQGLNAGVTEETVKGLGLLLLFFVLRDEFDNVTDGIVYGALVGAGFAMVENFFYFADITKDSFWFLFVERIVLGWLCHSTFTACFGAALGYIRHTHIRWRQIVVPLIGYFAAISLHSFFDFIAIYANATVFAAPKNQSVELFSLLALIGDYIPPFIAQMILLYILIKSLAHEAAVIREFLASEVSTGVVKVDEYALLQNSFLRTRQERRVLWRHGFKQWLRVQALYQTEIGLAFRKWHVSMGDKPKLGYRQPEDAYRKRIQRLRKQIAEHENKR